MTLDQEDIQAIVKAVQESFHLSVAVPLDSVQQVQQQALQLVRAGKREESKELLKAYAKRHRGGELT